MATLWQQQGECSRAFSADPGGSIAECDGALPYRPWALAQQALLLAAGLLLAGTAPSPCNVARTPSLQHDRAGPAGKPHSSRHVGIVLRSSQPAGPGAGAARAAGRPRRRALAAAAWAAVPGQAEGAHRCAARGGAAANLTTARLFAPLLSLSLLSRPALPFASCF